MAGRRAADVDDDVLAWRDHGDPAAAQRLRELLHDDLVALGRQLGLLWANDESERAVRTALRLLRRHRATTWRRLVAGPCPLPAEVEADPLPTFRAMCILVLLDSARVPGVGGATSGAVVEQAEHRLRAVRDPA